MSDFKIYIHTFRNINNNVDTIFDWYVIKQIFLQTTLKKSFLISVFCFTSLDLLTEF